MKEVLVSVMLVAGWGLAIYALFNPVERVRYLCVDRIDPEMPFVVDLDGV